MAQYFLDRLAGLKDVGEVEDGKAGHGGPRHQFDLGLGYDAQGAFGTYHHAGHVEGRVGEELVQVVPADAPHDLWVALLDCGGVFLGQAAHAPVDFRFQAGAAQLPFQFPCVQWAKVGLVAVGQYHVQFHDVVQGLPVDHGMSAAGVVADAAAHAGAAGSGRVWGIHQPVRQQLAVKLVEDDAGLHSCPRLFLVDLYDLVQVLAEIGDNGVIDGLAGQARAARSWENRDAAVPGHVHHGQDVGGVAGDNHPHRLHLVNAGVGAVEYPGERIETDLAGHPLTQRLLQIAPLRRPNPTRGSGRHSESPVAPISRSVPTLKPTVKQG